MSQAGHRCVGACEIDKYARSIYARHFPEIPMWEDATTLDPKELPDFECLCAGFPCQAFSIAGARLGFEESRGTLFFEIARIAQEKRPKLLLLENVKGLLNHNRGRTFATIIKTLDELGYDIQWETHNTKYFLPQNRERVFIIGYLRGERTRKIFPLGEINKQTAEPKLEQLNNTPHDTGRIYHPNGIARSLRANSGGMGSKTGLYAVTKDHGKLRQTKDESLAIDANYWKGPDNHGQRTMIYMAHSKGNIKQRIQERNESWTLTDNSRDFGILAWSKSTRDWGVEERIKVGEANTLSTSDGCRSQSSMNYVYDKDTRIRRLTPKECERLQGFEDCWTLYGKDGEEISDTQRYRCMGNAVTIPVVKYVAENLS